MLLLPGEACGAVVPQLHLMGYWLGDAGFRPGCRVLVTVEDERLVVKVTEPPDPEWARKRLLKSFGLQRFGVNRGIIALA